MMLLAMTLLTQVGVGQSLYEDFNYTSGQNIGGNTGGSGGPVNNWYTHSNGASATGSVDVSAGSLAYTGLKSSTGNKVRLPGNNTTTPRDINIAITGSGSNTAYFSLLLCC